MTDSQQCRATKPGLTIFLGAIPASTTARQANISSTPLKYRLGTSRLPSPTNITNNVRVSNTLVTTFHWNCDDELGEVLRIPASMNWRVLGSPTCFAVAHSLCTRRIGVSTLNAHHTRKMKIKGRVLRIAP